jgi:hypothetical protein
MQGQIILLRQLMLFFSSKIYVVGLAMRSSLYTKAVRTKSNGKEKLLTSLAYMIQSNRQLFDAHVGEV